MQWDGNWSTFFVLFSKIDKLVPRYIWNAKGQEQSWITLSFHEALPLPDTKPGTTQLQWWRQSAPGATTDKRARCNWQGSPERDTWRKAAKGASSRLSEQSTFNKGTGLTRDCRGNETWPPPPRIRQEQEEQSKVDCGSVEKGNDKISGWENTLKCLTRMWRAATLKEKAVESWTTFQWRVAHQGHGSGVPSFSHL